ncbi:uncharacterized protein LOC117108825 [Anneissia japonica]|uniref:uncharacterized protein LOC117108825 n=1 Tax=Anneissia japonica TaxID=1529436 RepID=UPI00142552C9|nr:uncharacterized protein LOC117108825 [Anneissia japonica]XP_033106864.1 uncharacterized protein LOC117108825 [Anneissia japonica]XP_033106865.1 uncharacterized protein LOC117108825 [Anneissia japonica]XP_033106866.1 uncharacterized protein LOC117108825 [Anneissia japonica]XP_033106867.1 uncharacterized protein LOC117108825 [Anneissia japonica]XP_033106868.1 uncharacterized protein LOC117108825 [Anneissia japonica]XP_033106869.1 uncharacterized protein LOC117108825 [Anneissia japonica]
MWSSSSSWAEVVVVSVAILQYTLATRTTITPNYISIEVGAESIAFTCVSYLEPIDAIQSHWMEWKKNTATIVQNDTVLVDEAKYSVVGSSTISAITITQNLTVHNIELSDSGNYSCNLESTSQFFVKSSSSAGLSVSALKQTTDVTKLTNEMDNKKTILTPNYISIEEGAESITFTCVSYLEPIDAIQIHWMEWKMNTVTIVQNDIVLVDEAKYSVAGSSNISAITIIQNLTVHNIQVSDSGIYSCNLESTSQFFSKSSSSAELSVSTLKQTTDAMELVNEKDNKKTIIYFTAGGIILVLTFLGCIVIAYKIRSNDSATDNNNICSDDMVNERRISFYSNIDTNVTGMNTNAVTEMTEKTEPTYQKYLNIGLNDDSSNMVNTL